MSELEDAWAIVESSGGAGPELLQKRLFPESKLHLFAVVDPMRRYVGIQLQVRSTSVPSGRAYPSSGAFQVLAVRVGTMTRISIMLDRSEFRDVFREMCDDVLMACLSAGSDETQATRNLIDRLTAWRDLFRGDAPAPLGEAEQLGLLGELLFLERLLKMGIAPRATVGAWRGPLHDRHDFHFGPVHVEVKTTGSKPPYLASIASLEQLDETGIRQLFVWQYVVSVGVTEGLTLPMVIERLRAQVEPESVRLAFNLMLARARYLDGHASHYGKTYLVLSDDAFLVGDGFPALKRKEVPIAVASARYDLDLSKVPTSFAVGTAAAITAVKSAIDEVSAST